MPVPPSPLAVELWGAPAWTWLAPAAALVIVAVVAYCALAEEDAATTARRRARDARRAPPRPPGTCSDARCDCDPPFGFGRFRAGHCWGAEHARSLGPQRRHRVAEWPAYRRPLPPTEEEEAAASAAAAAAAARGLDDGPTPDPDLDWREAAGVVPLRDGARKSE